MLIGSLLIGSLIYAQQPPQGGAGGGAFWRKGGNLGVPTSPNIFGTAAGNNNPIYTYTNGIARSKLNGNVGYVVNGYAGARNGYLLIGSNANSFQTGRNLYTQMGAFSLLHINGATGNNVQELGYRPWMRTGVTFTQNQDLSYFGLRKLSTNTNQLDITETVLLWSDNATNAAGPDKLVFRFSGYGGSDGNSVSGNRLSSTDLDGLHVAQFPGLGLMGLGNTFGTNATGMAAANYVDPVSLLHLSYDRRGGNANERYGFMQVTYRDNNPNRPGSGETTVDGLRLGIDNQIYNGGLNAFLRWQENTPFIVQTDWNNSAGGIQQGERMRISSIAAPGVIDPANPLDNNVTRVAISHHGSQPITNPRSLLHLGYNTSSIFGFNLNDG